MDNCDPNDEFFDSFETMDAISQTNPFHSTNNPPLHSTNNPFLMNTELEINTCRDVPGLNIHKTQKPDLADAFLSAIQIIANKITSSNEVPLEITFSGLETEDPLFFLQELENYFKRFNIPHNRQVRIAVGQLKSGALTWYAPYRALSEGWEMFRSKFLQHFNSPFIHSQVVTALYGQKQKSEDVAIFISRKRNLFHRLNRGLDENNLIPILLEQISPQIRAHLRTHNFFNLDHMIQIASLIEKDLSSTSRTPTVNNNQPNVNRPQTPCRYCAEWHFHRECPRNPSRQFTNTRQNVRPVEQSRQNPENSNRDARNTANLAPLS
ncbi:unnamed protein product [Psylliodes chrysocephalus]|uniref:Ty3 transposon capsid-like protein domain-containing protein n=1 Tax=Psylliodes chrysocephalus TaxID=3402493 RepID=A0A9P0G9P5_9CUCU|nr:unnamed protein product [Psylliodes chrysocephala]